MKKLNNQEINALTNSIAIEILENNKSKVDSIKSKKVWEKEFKKTIEYKEFNKINALLAQFREKYSKTANNVSMCIYEESLLSFQYREYSQTERKRLNIITPNVNTIKNKIILSQIECENLQEIINNIKKEYNLIVQ